MNKIKVEVYREVLRDVSQNFEGAENFIKQQIEEIFRRKIISVEEVFNVYIFLLFLVLSHDLNLTLQSISQSITCILMIAVMLHNFLSSNKV